MKKRNFCTETKRVVYIDRHNVAHCALECVVDLSCDGDGLPWELLSHIRDKYPNITYKCCDTFTIHIETKATCHGGDIFDEKKGKTIAYSKAQLKLYNLLSRIYADMEKYYNNQKKLSESVKEMFQRYENRERNFVENI